MKQIKSNPVQFYGELKWESKRNYFVFDGINRVGIPKTTVFKLRKIKGHDYEFIIPEWLAKKKGII